MRRYLECGCCGEYHEESFSGDCRNDTERWTYQEIIEDIDGGTPNIEIVPLTEQFDISCGG